MKKILFFAISAVCLLTACQGEDHGRDGDSTTEAFSVQLNTDNTLRADVTINLQAPTTYHIEYWEVADPTTLKKTQPAEAKGHVKRTLILLKPRTQYACRVVYANGKESPVRTFTTQSAPDEIAHVTLLTDDMPRELPGYLLVYMRKSPGFVYLLNAKGVPVWYQSIPEGVLVANFEPRTHRLYMITQPVQNDFNEAYTGRIFKVIDLWGNTIVEKKLSTLPEMAGRKAHHECRPLPNGDAILVTTVDRKFDLRAQGGSANETVTGDGYVIINLKGKVVSQWDCFGTLNPTADPQVMRTKEDWLHANSINYDQAGNYYMSFNRRSELWKINPATGHVIYRLGSTGNVTMPAEGYADGMHCANPSAPDDVLVLDNGRNNAHGSRAVRYAIDPVTQHARLLLNSEVPRQYSTPNRGSAQLIDNNMLVFGMSVKNLILFTDCSRQARIYRILSLSHLPYRAEYIPSIEY